MNRLPYTPWFLLALLVGSVACGSGDLPGARVTGEATNVLLVVLDTVRADRLSSYGYHRPLTPHLDRLASRGIRFDSFFSNSSWTLPAHASLFTGLYPVTHQATQETLKLSADAVTLAEILQDAGYRTFASSSNPVVSRSNGLDQGFFRFLEVFRSQISARFHQESRHPNNVAFEQFLRDCDRTRPYFAFLNYIEAHLPYEPPQPFQDRYVKGTSAEELQAATTLRMPDYYLRNRTVTPEMFDLLGNLYDGEIAYLDSQMDDLYNVLVQDGRLDRTLVIITSDHGENLGEHGHFAPAKLTLPCALALAADDHALTPRPSLVPPLA